MKITTLDGEPLDLALWRSGVRTKGSTEAALDGNYGLAAKPPVLDTRVAVEVTPVAKVVATVKLWD